MRPGPGPHMCGPAGRRMRRPVRDRQESSAERVRAPVEDIFAPLFPTRLPWVNVPGGRASTIQRGKPMLVEFWDFCRPNSLRTLPYVKAWHERYARAGLRVIGVHCPGFEASRDEQAVRDAVARLDITHP